MEDLASGVLGVFVQLLVEEELKTDIDNATILQLKTEEWHAQDRYENGILSKKFILKDLLTLPWISHKSNTKFTTFSKSE